MCWRKNAPCGRRTAARFPGIALNPSEIVAVLPVSLAMKGGCLLLPLQIKKHGRFRMTNVALTGLARDLARRAAEGRPVRI
ncbi:hypothetical protein EN751_35395, partial [Mesorhizobium sp. M4A.F.Ca.ET.029.04.2.1]